MSQDAHSIVVGVPKETFPGERRVALTPAFVKSLREAGIDVLVEVMAGREAGFTDADYRDQGARLISSRSKLIQSADVLLQVRAMGANPNLGRADIERLHHGQCLIGLCDPLTKPSFMSKLADRNVTCFALELLPRITRAQEMDVLSSMAMISGYKAVIMAAHTLPRMFPMMMTAAGTITPAKILVLGAGVAGLQAIATSRRLGAVVSAYDVRQAVKEEVNSLGAKFIEVDLDTNQPGQVGKYASERDDQYYHRQRELLSDAVAESHVVITTAAIPGVQAPLLVKEAVIKKMSAGSVLVDLAAEQGGNCELTQPNETIVAHDVTIIGAVNLPATIPYHASQMYSKNITTFLKHLVKDKAMCLDRDDEIISGTLVTRDGHVVHPQVREQLGLEPTVLSPVGGN